MATVAGRCVFLLDDDQAVRAVVTRILRGEGIKVDCFDNPIACLAKLRSQRCNLLITGLRMLEMDDIELLEEVRRLTPWVPILVMNGYGDIATAVRAIRTGVVDFIEKPPSKVDLVRKVKSMLEEEMVMTITTKPWFVLHLPELGRPFADFYESCKNSGVLDKRTKELLMVALACVFRCQYSLEEHIRGALNAGATKEEVTEVLLISAAEGASTQLAWQKDLYLKYLT